MSDPHLPPELERIIFVEAFRMNGLSSTHLLLVAKRVKEWLIPIVYEGVFINGRRFYPTRFDTLSQFEEYGVYIHHLLISTRPNFPCLNTCLMNCPNLTDLTFWWPDPPVDLDSLTKYSKLTHLTMDAEYLVRELAIDESTTQTQTPKFPNITHLDIFSTNQLSETDFVGLAHHFPSLTHIAFLWNSQLIEPALRNFKGIKAVVSWTSGLGNDTDGLGGPQTGDDRVIFVSMRIRLQGLESAGKGWERGRWEVVDDIMDKRAKERAKKVAEIRD